MLHFLVASLLLLLHSGRLAPIQDGVSGLFVVGIGLLLALSHLKARWGHAAGIAAACVSSALLPGATGLLILGIAVTLVCPPGVYRQGIAFLACTLFLFATGLVPPPLVNLSEAAYQAMGQTVAPGVAGAWLVPLAVASVWRAAVPPGGRRWSRSLLMLAIGCLLLVGLEVVVCAAYTTRAVFVAIPLLQLGILSAWAALLSMPNPAVVIRAPVGSRRHWLWLAAPAVVAGTLAPGWSERSVDSIAFYNEGGLDWDVPTAGKYGSYDGGMFGLLPVRLQREGFRVAAIEPEADIVAELQHHQVLFVINCPRHWSDEICAGIAAWVRDGGQLVVLADHTDVFGLMPGTNRLLANWSIGVRFDSAYHAREGWAGCIAAQAPGWTGAHRGFQLTHGIGASLTIGGEARSLFHGRWAFSDLGLRENFAGSFLGNYHWDRNEPFGDQVLVAQALDGRGAVTVYGDTTAFQNGALAGSLENHVLPLFGWLPRQPSAMRARMAGYAAAVALVLAWRFDLLAMLLAPLLLGQMFVEAFRWTCSPPTIRQGTVILDNTLGSDVGHYSIRWNGTGELVTTLQRAGLHVQYDRIDADTDLVDGLAFVAPTIVMSDSVAERAMQLAERGAVLVVTAGLPHAQNVAALTSRLGIDIENRPLGSVPRLMQTSSFEVEPRFKDAWPIRFATPAPPGVDWQPVCRCADYVLVAHTAYGQGAVVWISDSRFWSESNARHGYHTWPGNLRLAESLWSKCFPTAMPAEAVFPSHPKPN